MDKSMFMQQTSKLTKFSKMNEILGLNSYQMDLILALINPSEGKIFGTLVLLSINSPDFEEKLDHYDNDISLLFLLMLKANLSNKLSSDFPLMLKITNLIKELEALIPA